MLMILHGGPGACGVDGGNWAGWTLDFNCPTLYAAFDHSMKNFRPVAIWMAVLFALSPCIQAQSVTGQISGTVTDSTGMPSPVLLSNYPTISTNRCAP